MSPEQRELEPPWPSARLAWFVVVLLWLAFSLLFIDRLVLALLVEPIKADLGLTDTEIGFLQGFAFSLFYVVLGLPVGRLADRYSRRMIITSGMLIWSATTALCGLTRSFSQLFLARAGVAVGEATLTPAAWSLIADYFPREKLGRAIATYQSGAFVGAGIAFLTGGAVIALVMNSHGISLPGFGLLKPWQVTFLVIGIPGVLFALLMALIREPVRRGRADGSAASQTVRAAIAYGWERARLYGPHFIAFPLLTAPAVINATWAPTYFSRVLGLPVPSAARFLGLALLLASPFGVYAAGRAVDYLHRRHVADGTLRVSITAGVALLPCAVGALWSGSLVQSQWVFPLLVLFSTMPAAVAPTVLQLMTPNHLRGQMSAAYLISLNLLAAGLAPTAVGFVTTHVLRDDLAVGRSMALVDVSAVAIGLALLLLRRRAFHGELSRQGAGT